VGGGCWVGMGSVVDLCGRFVSYGIEARYIASHTGGNAALAQEADHGLATRLEHLGCVHWGMR